MQPLIKANQLSAAANNRRLIVQLLREEPLSRRQLASQTGLQNSSVTYIVRDLMEQGIVRSIGKLDRPGVGKKQVLLEVNPSVGWVVGVGLESESASLVFLDAAGRTIDRDRFPIREPFRLVPEVLRTRVDNWVARHGRPEGKLLGVGVGVPGIVDNRRGVVLRSTLFGLQNHALSAVVSEAFGANTHVDNDSNCATLAEARMGSAAGMANFLYLLMNVRESGKGYAIHSLGSSLFLGGNLYRGSHFGAGEIDTVIDSDPYGTVTAEHLLLIARPDGDFPAELRPVAERIVRSLIPLADLVDPSVLVLGGSLCVSNRRMLALIEEEVNRRLVPVPDRHVGVRSSAFIDYGVAMGAAIAALDDALEMQPGEESPTEAFPTIANAQPYPA